MIIRKHIVHFTGVGVAYIVIFYSASCTPLPFSSITQFIGQNINPACEIASYNIEPAEWPQNSYLPVLYNNSAVFGTASNVSTSAIPYSELTKMS